MAHHSPDVWVAVGTMLLAVITGVLSYYTWRLFKATQAAHNDATSALTIAQESLKVAEGTLDVSRNELKLSEANAHAAQKSVSIAQQQMESSLRPYVVVEEIKRIKNIDNFIPLEFAVVVTNVGEMPALDVVMNCFAGVEVLAESGKHAGYTHDDGIKQLKGIIGKGQLRDLQTGFTEAFINHHQQGLLSGWKQLRINGTVTYRDMLSQQDRETEFTYVWHSQRGNFTPVEELGNTMT
jgi:hypothetical protein